MTYELALVKVPGNYICPGKMKLEELYEDFLPTL